MARSVAVALDGVIRKPLDLEAQDMGGSLLFRALTQEFRVVVLGSADYERDKQFMLLNGLSGYVKIEPVRPEDESLGRDRRTEQLKRLRAEGHVFEFVVVPDPVFALGLINSGFPVLVYAHPAFSERLARSPALWDDLKSRVEADQLARAKAAQVQ